MPTASGATAVQVIWRYVNNKPVIDHIGSAHSDRELAVLRARAQQLIDGSQMALDLGISDKSGGPATGSKDRPLTVIGQRAGCLLDAIRGAFVALGLDAATGGDRVFYDLVTARIIHPGSKADSIETLAEVGVESHSYSTIQRAVPGYATHEFCDRVSRACASYARIGPGVLVLYDVTTLYFETDTPDDLRKPGFSKERRLEPQITVGMLTDMVGLPLSIGAFEGNKAETHTMIPMIRRLAEAYDLTDITVVADSGMFSQANKQAIIDAGLYYILGTTLRDIPYPVDVWRTQHPGDDYTDGQIWQCADRRGRGREGAPHTITYYQYSQDRARRTRKGITEQLDKAQRAVDGIIPVKRNRYVDLKAPHKKVNYPLADKHMALAGIKGYETNRTDLTAQEVIGFYRRLFRIEKSFRMAKSDLKARPIYHRKHDSIQAHLIIVMAAMACGHVLEQASGLSLQRLVRTLKKYEDITVDINGQTFHAHTPIPDDVEAIITRLPKPD